jgi:hypothetical protein
LESTDEVDDSNAAKDDAILEGCDDDFDTTNLFAEVVVRRTGREVVEEFRDPSTALGNEDELWDDEVDVVEEETDFARVADVP